MIYLYTTPSCLGCRNAKAFLIERGLKYVEKDFSKKLLNKNELLEILKISENGIADIISERSKIYGKIKTTIDDFTLNEILELIINQPAILRRPIILQKNFVGAPVRIMIGYNKDDIEIFLRSDNLTEVKTVCKCPYENICKENCPIWKESGYEKN